MTVGGELLHTCHRCGEPFLGAPRGPKLRHCPACQPARQRAKVRAYWGRWPTEQRRARWRQVRQAQRRADPEYDRRAYHARKRRTLRRAMAGTL